MKTIAALAVALLSLAAPSATHATAAPAPAAHAQQRTVYVNIGNPEVKPRRIDLAYSSAPYINRLTWKSWGSARAVGTGVYVSTCASCAPPRRRAATVVLTRPRPCPGRDYTAYRKAIVTVSKPDQGSTDTTYTLTAPCR